MPTEWRRDMTPEQYQELIRRAPLVGPLPGIGPRWIQWRPSLEALPSERPPTPRPTARRDRGFVRPEQRDLYPTGLGQAVLGIEAAGQGPTGIPAEGITPERGAYLGQLLFPPTRVPGAYGAEWSPTAAAGGGVPGAGAAGAGGIPAAWRPMGAGWWEQFREEHGGTRPDVFYDRTREGVEEAYADRQWGDEFFRMYGRGPSQSEWEEHWYQTRTGHGRPLFSREQWAYLRRQERQNRPTQEPTPQERAPLMIPNPVSWRTGPY